jgi:hypothetical protein
MQRRDQVSDAERSSRGETMRDKLKLDYKTLGDINKSILETNKQRQKLVEKMSESEYEEGDPQYDSLQSQLDMYDDEIQLLKDSRGGVESSLIDDPVYGSAIKHSVAARQQREYNNWKNGNLAQMLENGNFDAARGFAVENELDREDFDAIDLAEKEYIQSKVEALASDTALKMGIGSGLRLGRPEVQGGSGIGQPIMDFISKVGNKGSTVDAATIDAENSKYKRGEPLP